MRLLKPLSFLLAAMAAVVFSSCQPARGWFASRAVAEDSTVFIATVRVIRDSVGASTLVVPEPLSEGHLIISSNQQLAVRSWRERWLRSTGFLSPSKYEPCSGIFVFGRGKSGCPTTSLNVARVSRVSGWGARRELEVSVRMLGPAGSSDERFNYVFSRRGLDWALVAVERGVIIE